VTWHILSTHLPHHLGLSICLAVHAYLTPGYPSSKDTSGEFTELCLLVAIRQFLASPIANCNRSSGTGRSECLPSGTTWAACSTCLYRLRCLSPLLTYPTRRMSIGHAETRRALFFVTARVLHSRRSALMVSCIPYFGPLCDSVLRWTWRWRGTAGRHVQPFGQRLKGKRN
jgi:hypothetical protein